MKNSFFTIWKSNFSIIKRIFTYAKGDRPGYYLGLLINAFSMIRYSFAIGFPIKWVTDSFMNSDWEGLKRDLVYSAIIIFVNSILIFVEGYLLESKAISIAGRIKKALLSHFLLLKPRYFDKNHSGDLLSRLNSDLKNTEYAVAFDMVDPVNGLSLGVSSIVFIAILNWQMGVIAAGLSVLIMAINAMFLDPIKRSSTKVQSAMGKAAAKYSDLINGIPVIKIFNLQLWIYKHYDHESRKILKWGFKLNRLQAVQVGLNDLLDYITSFGLLAVGVYFFSIGEMTAGGLLAIKRYASVLTMAFIFFGQIVANLTSLLASAERVFEIVDEEKEKIDSMDKAINQENGHSVITFDNLSFEYDRDVNVLSNINEVIQRNETVALVGQSGSGKTTLMQLIMGFYDLEKQSGDIRIFGQSISDLPLTSLRDLITYVPQENFLFMGTIKDNILFGRPDASDAEIIEAAKHAQAHEFIMNQPNGYDTSVGERGASLSGGQRQRIAITRAFLKNSPILLLDEATASLDSASEEAIHKALQELMRNRTVLIAAHRLSTIRHADKILVLEKGRIIESGNHNELLGRKGEYEKFHQLQYR